MVYFNYYLSVIIWQLFNPFGIYQSLLQNIGQVISIFQSFFRKDPVAYSPMSLPFYGKWKVINGGIDKLNSHSRNIISQRYAYDFILSGEESKKLNTQKHNVNDYLTFNEDVYSPNDGIIIKVKNSIRDNKHAGSGWIDIWTTDIRGNFVIIKHDKNVYSLIAHLKRGSCCVKKGDIVKRGQIIGKCGNSGHSTQPHIHFQLQDKVNWYFSKGLPIIFSGIMKKNENGDDIINMEQTYISKNDIVSNIKSERAFYEKIKPEMNISKDLINPLVVSLVNTQAIIIGGGFIYYTIIKSIFRIVLFIIR